MTPRALLAADCGSGVGLGHLERMLALADALRPTMDVALVVPDGDDALHRRVVDRGHISLGAAGPTPQRIEAVAGTVMPFDVIVLDGYCFGIDLQRRLRGRALLTVVDDLRLPADCDLAVNPSPGGERLRPEGADAFLGGAAYALIRAVFLDARAEAMHRARDHRSVLVSTGATDLNEMGRRVSLDLLERDPMLDVVRVVGPDTPVVAGPPRERLLIAPHDLAGALASASVYVGAAGTTAVQAACVGTPAVITAVVSNQTAQAAALATAGCAVAVETAHLAEMCRTLLDDPELRMTMAARGRALVDGQGASRVAGAIGDLVARRAA